MSAVAIRVVLVDDEQPARERLRRLLAELGGVEIVGEAEDGPTALDRIAELRPDLVLLDIQMPGASGLEVAAALPAPRPRIVFCTAYDEYAVEAFELEVADYLLKPVNRARLAQALERVRGRSAAESEAALDRASREGLPLRFLAKRGSKYHVIPREEVVYFVSEGGLTRLQTAEQHYWMQPTLAELEQRLDPARFFRVSRSAILHLDGVREITPQAGGHGEVLMADGQRLEVSRRRFRDLLERLGT